MILALDVGNSQIYGGLFDKDKLVLRFRQSSQQKASSDELGLFLRQVLKENNQDPAKVEQVAICSVVPSHTHALKNCCMKYFDLNPFLLQAGAKTGLKIKYRNPLEVGADRIANAIAISHLYPNEPIIAVDLGTATTFDVISGEKEYLGGAIMPGLRLSMESLEAGTAKLPVVEIVSPEVAVGRSTVESIQSGLFYGHLGAMREFIARISKECFRGEEPKIIGTGGFANLFQKEKIFHAVHPDLVLKGLYLALKMNI